MCIYKYGSMVSIEKYFSFFTIEIFYIHWSDFCIYLSAPSKLRAPKMYQWSYCPSLGPVYFRPVIPASNMTSVTADDRVGLPVGKRH